MWAQWARTRNNRTIEDTTNNVLEGFHHVIKQILGAAIQGQIK